jgi:hypothetical protein
MMLNRAKDPSGLMWGGRKYILGGAGKVRRLLNIFEIYFGVQDE